MAASGENAAAATPGFVEPSVPPVAADLVAFLNSAWTPFHAVDEAKRRLTAAGFQGISEADTWQGKLAPGGKYFFTRNYSTIVAFYVGTEFKAGDPFWMIGAHTDSPCLKVKPVSKVSRGGCLGVGVQTYGGGLWHTWFDRDLALAGRVIVREGEGEGAALSHRLVRVARPILRIPTLAIHLDREVTTEGFKVNRQQHLLPILATAEHASRSAAAVLGAPADPGGAPGKGNAGAPAQGTHHALLLQLLGAELGCGPEAVLDFELQLCDTQPSAVGGALNEFVFSGRLDNLCSSFCALQALIDATSGAEALPAAAQSGVHLVALFDHEECGSDSAQGAGSPVLGETLRRVTLSLQGAGAEGRDEALERALRRSFLVSADMAHCLHPNYADKHDDNHQPAFHRGLVIKTNANQRYATDAVSAALFKEVARTAGVPTQEFVVRNDMACGSTIGPILASGFGVRTVDVGAPQLSMHSVREMCAVDDVAHAHNHFTAFFRHFASINARLNVD